MISENAGTSNNLQTPEDYRKAIASLEASTKAIESQISTTQQIFDTLTSKQQKPRPTTQTKQQALSDQISSQHSTLERYLTTTSADLKKAISSTLITVDDTLSRDDYTFDQITQSLSAVNSNDTQSNINDHDDNANVSANDDVPTHPSTSTLLTTLTRTESSLIRTHLERIYFETFNSSSAPSETNGTHDLDETPDFADPTRTAQIQSDLRTLYSEIDDVTSLFVGHEHGDVLTRLNSEVERTRRVLRVQRCEWAVRRIREMTVRLNGIEEVCRGVQGQRVVVGRLGRYLGEIDAVEMGAGTIANFGKGETGSGRGEADGPALVGLRGYLGVGGGGDKQADRIDEVFREVKGVVERMLEVQESQVEMLRDGRSGKEQDPGNEEAGQDSRSACGAMLDGLDGEIATIKEGIETLPR